MNLDWLSWSNPVAIWWIFLIAVSGANITLWLILHRRLRNKAIAPSSRILGLELMVLLCAAYVFGCAFRSAFPVYDVQRVCLFDSWLSSVIIGRSVATVAELCFVAQWALLLRELARATGSVVGKTTWVVLLPLIAIAETCSWYSVLTTSNLGHVAEETIWGLSAAMLVVSLIAIRPRCDAVLRPLLAVWCAAAVVYVGFMFLVDVPMYWSRWLVDEASGRRYLSIAQGMLDVSGRRVVSHRWEDWKNEVTWMSLYFSAAVWLSIALVHAPVRGRRAASAAVSAAPEVAVGGPSRA